MKFVNTKGNDAACYFLKALVIYGVGATTINKNFN